MTKTVYMAVMPGHRKPKAVPPSALDWYKANAKLVWKHEGTAEEARRLIENGKLKPFAGLEHTPEPPVATTTTGYASVSLHSSTHAALHKLYDPRVGRHVLVGRPAQYGPVDDRGAEYKSLGGPDHRYSKDHEVGLSYNDTVFVYGDNEEGEPLSHDQLEAFLVKAGYSPQSVERVVLHRGTARGGIPTWMDALQFVPPERAPFRLDWGGADAERSLKARFPQAEVMRYGARIDVSGDNLL